MLSGFDKLKFLFEYIFRKKKMKCLNERKQLWSQIHVNRAWSHGSTVKYSSVVAAHNTDDKNTLLLLFWYTVKPVYNDYPLDPKIVLTGGHQIKFDFIFKQIRNHLLFTRWGNVATAWKYSRFLNRLGDIIVSCNLKSLIPWIILLLNFQLASKGVSSCYKNF